MAQLLNLPPQRFTYEEWYLNTKLRRKNAQDQQQLAESVIADSDRVCDETRETTETNAEEVDAKLEARIHEIEYFKNEIEKQRTDLMKEIDALSQCKERLTGALKSLDETNIEIGKKCLALRETRLGIDLVQDDIETELHKEIEVLQGVRNVLRRTLEQLKEQLRLLRSALYFLDKDHGDKTVGLNIDKYCVTLKNNRLGLSLYHGNTPLNTSKITYEEWENFTLKNIERAAKEINNSRPLQSYIKMILDQTAEDLMRQNNLTNAAFERRILETKSEKEKLEKEHAEIVKNVNDMMRSITRIEKEIADKESYMALAHTRMGHRAQRPNVELNKDEAEGKLVMEVADLQESTRKLQERLTESEACLRYLLRNQVQLEEDINIKLQSLDIDEVQCMTERQKMHFHKY